MATWKKSSPSLVQTFDDALPDDPAAERRQMFGYPCAFARGNMFTGLHEERMVVRLPEPKREALLAERARLVAGRDRSASSLPPPTVAITPETSEESPHACDVVTNLGSQGFERRRFHLLGYLEQEPDDERLTVEAAREAEEMRFDERLAATDRWANADVGDGAKLLPTHLRQRGP